jgi:uncharacterized protein (DUF1778 family)
MTTPNKQQGALTKVGITLAEVMLKADNSKRTILIELASKYSEKSQYDIILDSYAKSLTKAGMNENSVKVRKSEALAVFKAVSLTDITGNNAKTLNNVTGGYHVFIDTARTLAKDKTKAKPAPREVKELTENQAKVTSENLEKANISQLTALISEASNNVIKKAPQLAGKNQLGLILAIANNMLSNKTIEKPILLVAQSIADQCMAMLDNIAKTQAELAKLSDTVASKEVMQEATI